MFFGFTTYDFGIELKVKNLYLDPFGDDVLGNIGDGLELGFALPRFLIVV